MYRWAVPTALARRLARIRERTGWPVARQLRRAVDEYLDQHDDAISPRAGRVVSIITTRGGNRR